ncbi:hypothetical protein OPV22_034687 [Ensete ventricosum]|uniref:WRKY domain-containing protein n=1 Tax=Ensete ventricosum TaxID=4639 RepID=A0AAV8PTC5_ENSVE|nr:hypothetical protein OPV22_034687 [Ensete ventricosum]
MLVSTYEGEHNHRHGPSHSSVACDHQSPAPTKPKRQQELESPEPQRSSSVEQMDVALSGFQGRVGCCHFPEDVSFR